MILFLYFKNQLIINFIQNINSKVSISWNKNSKNVQKVSREKGSE